VNVIVSPHLYSSGFLSVTPLIQGLFTAAKQQAVAAMTQKNATALFIQQFLQPTPFRYFTRYNTTVDERFSEGANLPASKSRRTLAGRRT
jgi:hypothetical protein